MSCYRFNLALLLLLSVFVNGCAINPATGQQQLMLVSEFDESRMGQATDQSVVEQYGVYPDAKLQNYLQTIGLEMARRSHRPMLEWHFKVMDSPVVNAFAAPGGYIYVTRGLLAAVNNEAELAGVVGHEIGHVTARHSAQQYSNKMLAGLGLSLGQGLLGSYGDAFGPLLETGAGLLFLKFSRDDESESDALGVEYATLAGYDTGRMADFFVTLQRQGSVDGQEGQRLPEFFSTHPNPLNREANVRAMARERMAKSPGRGFLVNRDPFLSMIDGLVFGDDPRLGFHEEGWYFLPQFQVKLPVPKGWSIDREGNNLQLKHPEKKAVVLVSIRPGSNLQQAVAKFLEATGAKVNQEQSLHRDGMSGKVLYAEIGSGQNRAFLISHFFQKGPDVFAFHGMTDEAGYPQLSELIQSPGAGFSLLTDLAKLHPQPQRIKVEKAVRSTPLQGLLETMKVDRALWDKIAWLNGRRLTDRIMVGEKIKIIR